MVGTLDCTTFYNTINISAQELPKLDTLLHQLPVSGSPLIINYTSPPAVPQAINNFTLSSTSGHTFTMVSLKQKIYRLLQKYPYAFTKKHYIGGIFLTYLLVNFWCITTARQLQNHYWSLEKYGVDKTLSRAEQKLQLIEKINKRYNMQPFSFSLEQFHKDCNQELKQLKRYKQLAHIIKGYCALQNIFLTILFYGGSWCLSPLSKVMPFFTSLWPSHWSNMLYNFIHNNAQWGLFSSFDMYKFFFIDKELLDSYQDHVAHVIFLKALVAPEV
jgi:peroxiredoxin